jgi:hypothetical protein
VTIRFSKNILHHAVSDEFDSHRYTDCGRGSSVNAIYM